MSQFTFFPMQGYWGKVFGVISSMLLMFLLLITSYFEIQFLKDVDLERQSNIIFWLIIFGLYMIVMSKEKIEDDRVKAIRYKSLQFGYGMLLAPSLAINLGGFLMGTSSITTQSMSFYIPISLVLYLVHFHYGLYFDPSSNYNDNGPLDNVVKNKKFFLIYTLLIVIPLLYWVIF